jgi:SMI1-KNR4 cell-wall
MMNVFNEPGEFTGHPVNDEQIRLAEALIGFPLPFAYSELLKVQNGGVLRKRCFATQFSTSWASDHFALDVLLGVGGDWGIDAEFGSRYFIAEWGYPDIGIVIALTPSGGHDTVMLDYTACGPDGEPSVVYIDEDRVPRRIAATFEAFLAMTLPGAERIGSNGWFNKHCCGIPPDVPEPKWKRPRC